MTSPSVTIVVTQRERVSAMQEALESLYADTSRPFELIYVTGRLGGGARRWLETEAQRRGFLHIDAGRRLTPAEARNLGAIRATSAHVLFIENDVVVQAGWLDALLRCADETRADVVAPLTCEGRPLHTVIHYVGTADTNQATFGADGTGLRDYHEAFHLQGCERTAVADQLRRRRTLACEMHCFMVRRAFLEQIGYFDPMIVSKEYLDFSWGAEHAGAQMWIEPAAVVTFLIPSKADPVRARDLPDFLLRWSHQWQRRSHDALKAKWGLQETGYIAKRRAMADWRVVDHLAKPLLEKVPVLGRRWGFVTRGAKLVYPLLSLAGTAVFWRYERDRRRAEKRSWPAHA